MQLRQFLSAAGLALSLVFTASVNAQTAAASAAKKPAATKPVASTKSASNKVTIEAALRRNLGDGAPAITGLQPAPIAGLWEFSLNGDVFYTDATGRYMFQGSLIDLQTRTNLTDARSQEINRVDFAKLPLELAMKTVKGDGKRVFAMFADPNCGYCKMIEKTINESVTNVTIYTFFFPILSPDSELKSKQIWCAADKQKAWDDWMLENKAPSGDGSCATPVSKIVELGRQLKVNGTPTLFFPDGSRIPGAMQAEQLEQKLNQSQVAKK